MENEFLTASRFRNFKILVEQRELFVNPHMLANLSPVFERMCLNPDYDEAKNGSAQLKEEKFEEIHDLFRAIMTTENSVKLMPITAENAASLLRLADKFDISPLLSSVDEFLSEADLSKNSIGQLAFFLSATLKHNFTRKALRNATVYASMLPFKDLLQLNENGTLPSEVMPFCFALNGAQIQSPSAKINDLRAILAKLVKALD